MTMTPLQWNQVGNGYYETSDRAFQAIRVSTEYGIEWRLMIRDNDSAGNWVWCQTFNLLREAKAAAESINTITE